MNDAIWQVDLFGIWYTVDAAFAASALTDRHRPVRLVDRVDERNRHE